MKKAMYYMVGIIIMLSFLLAGAVKWEFGYNHWIAIPARNGDGYFLVYDGKEPPLNPYRHKEWFKKATFKKLNSRKSTRWTIEYYEIEIKKSVKIDYRSPYAIEPSGVTTQVGYRKSY